MLPALVEGEVYHQRLVSFEQCITTVHNYNFCWKRGDNISILIKDEHPR